MITRRKSAPSKEYFSFDDEFDLFNYEFEENFAPTTSFSKLSSLTPIQEKALRITTMFETGKPLNFAALAGNFDGQGLSFGLLQWNIGTGSLIKLLREFDKKYPKSFDMVFGSHANVLRKVLVMPKNEQIKFAYSINDNKKKIIEPWASYFKQLGNDPNFQQIQIASVRQLMSYVGNQARKLGLKSERGFALIFDNVTQNGQEWLNKAERASLISKAYLEVEKKFSRPPTEREKLEIIANVVANTVKPEWREDVRQRRMTIVNGVGVVHKTNFDLKRQFGLTDQPWETNQNEVSSPLTDETQLAEFSNAISSQSIDLDKAIRLNKQYGQSLGWQNQFDNIVSFLTSPDEKAFAKAIAHWQKSKGLKADGIVGPNTWAKMRASMASSKRFVVDNTSNQTDRGSSDQINNTPEILRRGTISYNGKTVSDPILKKKLEEIAAFFGRNISVTSGDRNYVPLGGSKASLHLARRAVDFGVDGLRDEEVFFALRSSNLVKDDYEVIWHGSNTATGGPHIHLGRYADGRASRFKIEGVPGRSNPGVYTRV